MPFLTITSTDGRGKEQVVALDPAAETQVGRSPDSRIVLNDSKVSRAHLRLAFRDNAFWATDAGSTFGTLLNGVKLAEPAKLAAGDRLQLGGYVLLYSEADPGAKPPAPGAAAKRPSARPEEAAECAMDPALAALAVLYTDEMMAMKKRIHEQVLFKLNLPEIATKQIQDDELRAKLEVALDQVLREVRHELPRDLTHDLFRQTLLDELIGYGPITPMLRDATVDEVMVNGPGRIFVERKGRLLETGARFFDDRHLITIIQRIVEPLGRHVDEASPMVDARLPDGSRVNAIIPPLALDGSSVTVR